MEGDRKNKLYNLLRVLFNNKNKVLCFSKIITVNYLKPKNSNKIIIKNNDTRIRKYVLNKW